MTKSTSSFQFRAWKAGVKLPTMSLPLPIVPPSTKQHQHNPSPSVILCLQAFSLQVQVMVYSLSCLAGLQLRARSNLTAVLESLAKLGYQSQAVRMKASNYGLPQRRSRYYIICVQQDGFAEASSSLVKRICDYISKMQTSNMVKLVQAPVAVTGQ